MNVFNTFPILETDRLILKNVNLHSVEDAYEIYSDSDVMKGHGQPGLKTIDEVKTLIQKRFINPYEQQMGIRFGIYLKDTNKLIGACGFWRIEKEHFNAEIGYELSSKFHRKGYMKEALMELIRFGFSEMKLNRIEANTDQYNIASQTTLASVGFIREGIRKEAEFEDGSFIDMYSYAFLKREWKEINLERIN